MSSQEADYKKYIDERSSTLPKLVDVDYWVDLKQFNWNSDSVREAILKLDLLIEDNESKSSTTKKTTLELSWDQLTEIISNFDKINSQLTMLSGA